ncbi:MAG: phosphotransferase family protein [Acidimicrobiales bacterium]
MQGIDEERVGAWLDANVAVAEGPYAYRLIAGGRSNLTYTVTDSAGTRMVLRRPPLGHVLATAHDMAREHRIISAVGRTSVPVPRCLGLCTDETVNGAPFYVMSFVDGVVLDSPEKGELLPVGQRAGAADHLVDVLADLHAVDVDEVGLGDLARRDGYVERQVKRWSTQWENSKTRELPAIEEVSRLLAGRIPVQQGVSIAHVDYRFGNVLVDTGKGRVAAVLDWELCTLGDPLADLGYIGIYWTDPGRPIVRTNDPSGIEGFPSFDHLVERYASRTGRDVSGIGYYRAFASFRLAVISEGVYARYMKGAMGDQDFDASAMKAGTDALAEAALAALKGE